MANFSQIVNGKVIQIIVVSEEDCGGLQFPGSEPVGQQFLADCQIDGEWRQYSLDGTFRGTAAGIGYTWTPNKRRNDGGIFEPPADIPIEATL